MADIIRIPRLDATSNKVKLIHTGIKMGDELQEGDLIAEIETDSATVSLVTHASGKVIFSALEIGEFYQIGEVVMILGEGDEDIEALLQEDEAEDDLPGNAGESLVLQTIFIDGREFAILDLVGLRVKLLEVLDLPASSSSEHIIEKVEKLKADKKGGWFG